MVNDNRKVKFAETFAQREEIKVEKEKAEGDQNEEIKTEVVETKTEGIEEEAPAEDKKPKKMKINQEYVKEKVKQ